MLTKTLTVALVGNPNAGKTTLFNALSGLRQRVGNYPGVTVELKKGHFTTGGVPVDLIDLPGTYSLAARSPDEMVAVDLLLGRRPEEPRPDVVLSIVGTIGKIAVVPPVATAPEAKTPIYKKWWLWTIVGVVVVGAGVGAGVGVALSSGPCG